MHAGIHPSQHFESDVRSLGNLHAIQISDSILSNAFRSCFIYILIAKACPEGCSTKAKLLCVARNSSMARLAPGKLVVP
jgi:hypothetical protein